jgi:hypothetical protein
MKKVIFRTALLVMASAVLNGCGRSSNVDELLNKQEPPDSDITTSPGYNFSSFSGTAWKTKVKVALADLKTYKGVHHTELLVPKHFDTNQPDYTPVDDMKVIDVLPVGTRLRIGRLIQDNGIGSQLWVTGTLVDATNLEKDVYLEKLLLKGNTFILKDPSLSTNWGVNPDMLEPATNAP